MSDGIVFVLHGGGDEAYATGLAAALAPLAAFPARLPERGARGVQFGAGGVCVVAWTPALHAQGAAGEVLTALEHARANAVVCRVAGAPAPHAFAQLTMIDAAGEPAADAARVREAIAAIARAAAERETRRRAAPKLAAPGAPQAAAAGRKPQLALRSAYGLAATLAVAGVVAPTIIERAQATSADPHSLDLAPEAAHAGRLETEAATLTAAVVAPQLAPTPTPALDAYLTAEAETIAASATADVAVATTPASAEADIADASFEPAPVLDPKRQAFSLEGAAAAKPAKTSG